jgi:nicotinamide mononucleotide transporter
MLALEIVANLIIALAIFFAGRNSIHTWWLGIIGCALFGLLFFQSQLYADVTLQGFFIITSIIGWYQWSKGRAKIADGVEQIDKELPITRTHTPTLIVAVLVALTVGAGYAWLLGNFTDAYAPSWDSLMLVLSVVAQILLMNRKLENWIFWLLVNTIAVPLFYSRGLEITAALYAAYWVHAIIAFRKWHKDYRANGEGLSEGTLVG